MCSRLARGRPAGRGRCRDRNRLPATDLVELQREGPGRALPSRWLSSGGDCVAAGGIWPRVSPATGVCWRRREGAGTCEPHLWRGRHTAVTGRAAAAKVCRVGERLIANVVSAEITTPGLFMEW
ncbi:hypothetical protein NDU88_000085 [Pleurodeles waltl]|uniref:Uncharacterized protein n=1 Tax=Pleurodeles waltl TaxID=8319 RepID=A0AAV7S621_PLEWA|nr:hypothetical protein NDU88_000085 [Pleurodeles waltl]